MSRVRTLRELAGWVVPPKLDRLLRRSMDHFLIPSLAPNRALRDRHRGTRRCFVIGNGPSLKGMDLRPLAAEITISANSFYKHPDAATIGLRYLCIGDPVFMIDEPRAIEWHQIIERAMPKTTLLLNSDARSLIAKHDLYPHHERFYVKMSKAAAHEVDEVNTDLARPLNVGNTTGTLIMIPLAMYLGFTEIYLLGFDANWLDNISTSYHFYDRHDQYPEFDSVTTDNRQPGYEAELINVRREFESHRLLQAKAKQFGVQIWNATAGGRVDTYPRIRFEDVIAQRPSA